ncbi:MAG: dihydropteroate synthase [Planctomycetota bacterium]
MSESELISDLGPWTERPPCLIELPSGHVLNTESRPLVVGILNVTPDSFSDGGRYDSVTRAAEHAREMRAEGADVIDVGGESTRPGAKPVSPEEEQARVLPVIKELTGEMNVPISIDTRKAEVAAAALGAGAEIINDVSALRADPEMAPLAAESGAPVILMHMQGTPKTMQKNPTYQEVVTEVRDWLEQRVEHAVAAGIGRGKLIVDPGFGFGKRLGHNLELLRRLRAFHRLGLPLMAGTSRKSMIGMILDAGKDERLSGTLATVAVAVMSGCHFVRVHDVGEAVDAVKVCEAVRRGITYGAD